MISAASISSNNGRKWNIWIYQYSDFVCDVDTVYGHSLQRKPHCEYLWGMDILFKRQNITSFSIIMVVSHMLVLRWWLSWCRFWVSLFCSKVCEPNIRYGSLQIFYPLILFYGWWYFIHLGFSKNKLLKND